MSFIENIITTAATTTIIMAFATVHWIIHNTYGHTSYQRQLLQPATMALIIHLVAPRVIRERLLYCAAQCVFFGRLLGFQLCFAVSFFLILSSTVSVVVFNFQFFSVFSVHLFCWIGNVSGQTKNAIEKLIVCKENISRQCLCCLFDSCEIDFCWRRRRRRLHRATIHT